MREQKIRLFSIMYGDNQCLVSKVQEEAIEGILSLLDALQDYAADVMNIPEELVFKLEENE